MPDSTTAIDRESIAAAVRALREGQIVVYPTETFYGLAVDPFSPLAMDRLFALKGRDAAKTIALIAPDAASAFALASAVPAIARKLADRFWPLARLADSFLPFAGQTLLLVGRKPGLALQRAAA